jgi:hypothetical protein
MMSSINLKDEVQRILAVEWNGFAERHPRLAEVIDQSLLVEQAAASIADDLDYQRALREAEGLEWSANMAVELVGGFVKDWLKRLL